MIATDYRADKRRQLDGPGPGDYSWSWPCVLRASAHTSPTFKEISMAALKGSKTEENLKAAFAGESQANRRYLYFANKADVEGQNDVAALFRSTAEGETGHAHGHLEWLEQCGDPATGLPIGPTRDNLKAAVA